MFKEALGNGVHVQHNLFYLLLINYGRTTLTKAPIIVNVVICRTAKYKMTPENNSKYFRKILVEETLIMSEFPAVQGRTTEKIAEIDWLNWFEKGTAVKIIAVRQLAQGCDPLSA